MPGQVCRQCGKMTFFRTPTGRKCSNCGYEMKTPANEGRAGRGKKCSNCGKFTVFNDKCRNCGAVYQ